LIAQSLHAEPLAADSWAAWVRAVRFNRITRAGILLLLLAAELLHFGFDLISRFNPTLQGWWWPIVARGRLLGEGMLGAALVAIFLSWPVFSREIRSGLSAGNLTARNRWLGLHLLCIALGAGWLAAGMSGGEFSGATALAWFVGVAILLTATALTWALAAIPAACWIRWLRDSRGALAAGALAGVLTCASGYIVQSLWPPLTYYTFVLVGWMLRALGLSVVSDPATALLGTGRFAVHIAPQCSGLEGAALISAFIIAYLWYYRSEYRFPAALLLLPAGIAIIWILNAVRITALILIGQWSSDLAVSGFHTVAGWILFNLTAFGIVSVSHNAGWLIRDEALADTGHSDAPNPAIPYLAPLLLTIAIAMLTAPFAAGFEAAYPIRVIVTATALWWYRERIKVTLLNISWPAAAIGVICFGLWIVLAHPNHAAGLAFAGRLRSLPVAWAGGWLLFRIIGAVVTVPLAEELAFRGYLQRKLINPDFASVQFDQFTWRSFLISSAAFGLLHQSWLAGIGAGMLFAAAVYYRGRLADAITAHAVANALLGVYVIATGSWSLWM
jgi:exosortase E/protease (VPEID-CTERM system)